MAATAVHRAIVVMPCCLSLCPAVERCDECHSRGRVYPALGFYHQPRSQAHPLALDLLELFRVPLVDLPVLASINRRQWDETEDFQVAGQQVWLSQAGQKKFIQIYERRKADQWKHPVIGHALSYARLIELEVRFLEKEWMNEGGLFARMRLR